MTPIFGLPIATEHYLELQELPKPLNSFTSIHLYCDLSAGLAETVDKVHSGMHDGIQWISTPDIAPDYRGPSDRPFVPFVDPAVAPTILELLESICDRAPNNIVVEDDRGTLTYAELWRSMQRVASDIRETSTCGHVAILLSSSAEYAVAIFACLAAGRSCVLLDENYPDARNAEIAAATGTQLVLTTAAAPSWAQARSLVVRLQKGGTFEGVASLAGTGTPLLTLDKPAFILCTSGSSGSPKPIVHSQRTMLHWSRTVHNALHVGPDDRAMSLSPLSSLGGITGLFAFCLAGAGVQMLDIRASGLGGLLEILQTRPISILRAVPSMMRGLARLPQVRDSFSRLRVIQTFGEPLMKADVAAIAAVLPAGCFIRSTYGSTEASGLSWFAGEPDNHDPLRAASGTLMPDTTAAIVDDNGRSLPCGSSGELWIRSRYNALGQWIDGRVVAGPLVAHDGGDETRIYRTGDVARCNAEGVFVVVGRTDRMIKVNGQRIEPAEIEAVLRRSNDVEVAEVAAHGNAESAKLMAFVVSRSAAPDELIASLRRDLRASLPAFMMPSRIFVLESMPLLPGGKVDRLALLALALGPTS